MKAPMQFACTYLHGFFPLSHRFPHHELQDSFEELSEPQILFLWK